MKIESFHLRRFAKHIRWIGCGCALLTVACFLYVASQPSTPTPLPVSCDGYRSAYLTLLAQTQAAEEMWKQNLTFVLAGLFLLSVGLVTTVRYLLRSVGRLFLQFDQFALRMQKKYAKN